MPDWSSDLNAALAAGDLALMKETLSRAPKEVLQRAIPYLKLMAKSCITNGKPEDAIPFYTQLIDFEPGNIEWHANRAEVYFKLDQLQEAILDAKRIVELQPAIALGHKLLAEAHDELRQRPQALAAYQQVLQLEPTDSKSKQRIQFLETELCKEALLKQTLDPGTANDSLQIEIPPPPEVTFDPALFSNPDIPETFEKQMVDGLRQHLLRYSEHQSSKNSLVRLEDREWVDAWDSALRTTKGSTVLFHGSELGVFALRARNQGSTRVFIAERSPWDQRIAGGIVQKNLLAAWHQAHGVEIQESSKQDRRASFEAFAKDIHVGSPEAKEIDHARCDYFVFPNIDHSLLGTGIVKAIRNSRSSGLPVHARILPAKAKLFAMAIQWRYQASSFELQLMNEVRWGFYPDALSTSPDHWTALSNPAPIGEIDFENFREAKWSIPVPINLSGSVDALVYWFELELGEARISNAPGSSLRCIKPAVQYVDSIPVERGQSLVVRINVRETRLHIETESVSSKLRSYQLPNWYIPMLLDRQRNNAFRAALANVLELKPSATVLDIGAGCGLLSMMAAQAGAAQVFGCEISPSISKLGQDIINQNGFDNKITFVNKDCRKMATPEDLPNRADLAVFELFDCSLIGEGVLHFVAYAREHLLKENARFLPIGGKIRATIIEYRLDRILDVDVNLLNPYRFSPAFINVDAKTLNYRALTESFDVFEFDFSNAAPIPEEKELIVPAITDGIAGAVLFWFDLQLEESIWLSNDPQSAPLHWNQGLQFLTEALVNSDSQLPIVVKHDGSGLSFGWKQDAIPKENFSTLPRFDPVWWRQAKELEYQTRELLQHCMQNANEYKKVSELATRFAIDPASHDLDPIMAKRFAATFFGS